MTQMHTFRGGSNWGAANWADVSPDSAKTETSAWTYQESTGLLLAKTDDDGNSVTYTYDTLGRRDTMTQDPDPADTLPASVTEYTPDNLNQYDAITVDSSDPYVPGYDADGNMTKMALPPEAQMAVSSGDMALTWNMENRLAVVEPHIEAPDVLANGDQKVEFTYDYMGRRVAKSVYTYDTSTTAYSLQSKHLFLYDGWNLIQELDALNANAVQKSYVWGLDLSQSLQGAGGVGGLLAAADGTGTWYYCHDANGNVGQMVAAADGAIVAQYDYAPFGGLLHKSGDLADENVFRFSTKYHDTETGLYYYGYRYYETGMGRWTSRDPLEELGSFLLRRETEWKTADPNLYGFVKNNPIGLLDPFGLTTSMIDSYRYFNPSAIGPHPDADISGTEWDRTPPEWELGPWSAGIGAYAGVGGDVSYVSTTCCKNNRGTEIRYLKFCVGIGLGGNIKGQSLPGSISGGLSKEISSYGNTCPKTGDMSLEKEVTLALVAGIKGTAQAGNQGIGASVQSCAGVGASYEVLKICAIVVIDENPTNQCCKEQGSRFFDIPHL